MNKYLEKIAAEVSDKEIYDSGTRSYWKSMGGSLAGGMVIPVAGGIAGDIAGRAHELSNLKTKVTGKKAKMGDVLGEAGRGYLRTVGRGTVEGVGGAAAGGLVGAGLGALTKNHQAGAAIGASLGAMSGMIHGGWRSTHNSTRDFVKEWKKGK